MNFIKISFFSFLTALVIIMSLFTFRLPTSNNNKCIDTIAGNCDDQIYIEFIDDIQINDVTVEIEHLMGKFTKDDRESLVKIDYVIDDFRKKIDYRVSSLNNKNANLYLEGLYEDSHENASKEETTKLKKYYFLRLIQVVHQYGEFTNRLNEELAFNSEFSIKNKKAI